jgi:tRNA-splicing ligase RtcB (3'-phosphate/5'-hydroxy nucleic acid ligase)
MNPNTPVQIHATGEATGFIPAPDNKGKPITVIGTNSIRAGFDATCLQQAINSRGAPGVTDLVLNPDAHAGYGAPVGCVLTSPTHIYPGPVGVDIKCSMSFLQLDLPADQVADRQVRRALIDAILERTPTGPGRGQRSARKARKVGEALGVKVVTEGASAEVLHALGIPLEWAQRCEDAVHVGHDETRDALALRLDWLRTNRFSNFVEKITQLGSYGGGNHFGECEVVRVEDNDRARAAAEVFGLRDGCVGFLSHCGSRGFGHALATGQFHDLQRKFALWDIPLPGGRQGTRLCAARHGRGRRVSR